MWADFIRKTVLYILSKYFEHKLSAPLGRLLLYSSKHMDKV